jgi:hypothetical protein
VVPTVRLPLSIPDALADDIETLQTPEEHQAKLTFEVAEICGESLEFLHKPSQLKEILQKRKDTTKARVLGKDIPAKKPLGRLNLGHTAPDEHIAGDAIYNILLDKEKKSQRYDT